MFPNISLKISFFKNNKLLQRDGSSTAAANWAATAAVSCQGAAAQIFEAARVSAASHGGRIWEAAPTAWQGGSTRVEAEEASRHAGTSGSGLT